MPQLIEEKYKLDEPPQTIYNRKKEDYIRVALNVGSEINMNKDGDLIFEVDNQQSFLYLPESFLYAEFTLFQDDKFTTPLPAADNITLEHNFFPRLFNNMRLEAGAQTIETISTDPGIIDTMLKFVTVSQNKIKNENEGWIPDNGTGNFVKEITLAAGADKITEANKTDLKNRLNKHEKNKGYTKRKELYNLHGAQQTIEWPLFPLFGFLEYDKVTYQLRYKLTIHRTINNESIFYGETGKKAYIKLNKLELWIPHITPSIEIETMIIQRLNTNQPIPVTFLQRIASSYNFSAQQTTWHFTRISNTPRFLFVGIKKMEDSFERNNSKFISTYKYKDGGVDKDGEIKSIQVMLNQERYPIDPMRFDIANNNYFEGYKAYKSVCDLFGNDAQLSPLDWRNLYSIFCFDLTAQNEDLVKNGCDVTIKIEKTEGQEAFKAYAVALADSSYRIQVANGRMSKIE